VNTSGAIGIRSSGPGIRSWLGTALTAAGLLGHLLAANAIGATRLAYRDHILGFVGFGVISGVILAGLGWRFWRGRRDITMLVFGALQALLGLFVYIERFHAHG
jgi:hypothetical protein